MLKRKPDQQPIESLPYEVRKKILVIIVSVLMLVIFTGWLITLPSQFKSETTPNNNTRITDELLTIWEQTKSGINLTKEQLDQLPALLDSISTSTATTTGNTTTSSDINLTPEQIQLIKEAILKQGNATTSLPAE